MGEGGRKSWAGEVWFAHASTCTNACLSVQKHTKRSRQLKVQVVVLHAMQAKLSLG